MYCIKVLNFYYILIQNPNILVQASKNEIIKIYFKIKWPHGCVNFGFTENKRKYWKILNIFSKSHPSINFCWSPEFSFSSFLHQSLFSSLSSELVMMIKILKYHVSNGFWQNFSFCCENLNLDLWHCLEEFTFF